MIFQKYYGVMIYMEFQHRISAICDAESSSIDLSSNCDNQKSLQAYYPIYCELMGYNRKPFATMIGTNICISDDKYIDQNLFFTK